MKHENTLSHSDDWREFLKRCGKPALSNRDGKS